MKNLMKTLGLPILLAIVVSVMATQAYSGERIQVIIRNIHDISFNENSLNRKQGPVMVVSGKMDFSFRDFDQNSSDTNDTRWGRPSKGYAQIYFSLKPISDSIYGRECMDLIKMMAAAPDSGRSLSLESVGVLVDKVNFGVKLNKFSCMLVNNNKN